MEDSNCLRPAFWTEGHLETIKHLTSDRLIPLGCDLSDVLNDAEKLPELTAWLSSLKERGKLGLLCLSHDSSDPIDSHLVDNAVVLRTSMQSGLIYRNEHPMPVFVEGEDFESWKPISKSEKPEIGFVGHSKLALHHKLLRTQDNESRQEYGYGKATGKELIRTPVNIGLVIRSKALRILGEDERISTSFIERDSHFFEGRVLGTSARRDYLSNLDSNSYALCIRGSGNYSIRLYEAMAKGRIPVIVDTDLRLPLDGLRNWKQLGLFLNVNQVDAIGEQLIEFHNSLSPDQFVDLQGTIRAFWESNLQRESFLRAALPSILDSLVIRG
jgi:hypothetical protein